MTTLKRVLERGHSNRRKKLFEACVRKQVENNESVTKQVLPKKTIQIENEDTILRNRKSG